MTLSPRIRTNPPSAALYINGEPVGSGDERTHEIDFTNTTRCWIQAVRRGRPPQIVWLTRKQVEAKMNLYDGVIELSWEN